MEDFSTCENCLIESVVIENKLFYPEKKYSQNIYCPNCQDILDEKLTDGWFFTQTKKQYLLDKEKEILYDPMP